MEREIDDSWTDEELKEEKKRVEDAYFVNQDKHQEIEDYARMLRKRILSLDDEIVELDNASFYLTKDYIEKARQSGMKALNIEPARNVLLILTALSAGLALITTPAVFIATAVFGGVSFVACKKHNEYIEDVMKLYHARKKASEYNAFTLEEVEEVANEKLQEQMGLKQDHSALRSYANELLETFRELDFRKREIAYEEELRAQPLFAEEKEKTKKLHL